jgi:hypothetical protein
MCAAETLSVLSSLFRIELRNRKDLGLEYNHRGIILCQGLPGWRTELALCVILLAHLVSNCHFDSVWGRNNLRYYQGGFVLLQGSKCGGPMRY